MRLPTLYLVSVDHTELPRDSRNMVTVIELPKHHEVGM
jgi:hypothetical protein